MLDAAWIWDKAPSAHAPSEEESGTWDEELAENLPTTRYAYDGQMCALEDFSRYLGGSTMSVDKKRYALGARGIEMIESRAYDASGWSQAFPLYDGHGNMIATLSRGTGGAYQVSNLRSFDAWGGVRSGNTQGAPSQRYCASLRHVQDDESSLIYMRARYYEPTTGRFISEDPARDGRNWFVYCRNEPICLADPTGQSPTSEFWTWLFVDVVCGKLLGLIPAESPGAKAAKLVIDYTLSAISAVKLTLAIGAAGDSKVRAAMSGVATGFAVALFALAYHQLTCIWVIYGLDEAGPLANLHEIGESQAGFDVFDIGSYR